MVKASNAPRRNERSRVAVLTATRELCEENGYGRLTIEAIAARAKVSKMTIYRWWPSKGAIVLDLIDEAAAITADPPDTGDLAADLHTQLTEVITLLTPQPTSPVTGVITEAQYDPDLARDLRQRLIEPRITKFNNRLRQAQQQGQLPPDTDFDVALDLTFGPIYHRLALHLGMPDPHYLHKLIDHVLRALRPPE
ncbi:TetR/AcrR family transcriptional regulator [Actinomadura sp. NTSP31]|uniref:TetR/AcrR family transcriptional regulator n=1 Tax=Actinomadura sp. NTSP31 TaxID=1735447 RepID=UPI0035C24189